MSSITRHPESSEIIYPAIRGEYGILNYSYPVGHAWRYGVLPDGVDHENNGRMGVFLRNCCLPGITGYIPRAFYSFGFSTRAVMWKCRVESAGAEFANIIHQIGRASDFSTPVGTVSTTAGGVLSGNPAVSSPGNRYFRATEVVVQAADSAHVLTGARVHAVMEASDIDTLVSGGTGNAPGDVLSFANGIQINVLTVNAVGGMVTWSFANRGTTTDPTKATSGIWGNQYEQTSSTGSGIGARLIFDFRVNSVVTDNAGSGGPVSASGSLVFRPAQSSSRFTGLWITYGRHGVQDTKDSYMEHCVMASDATKNTNGTGNPGGHWDGNENFQFGTITVEDTQQGISPDNSGGAALSIDTSSQFQNRRTKGDLIYIKSAAWHGLALNGDLSCNRIRVDHAGKDAALTAANQFGAPGINAGAKSFLWSRGNLWCPDIHLAQNEEKTGAGFEYNFLCASTGVSGPSSNQIAGDEFADADVTLVDTRPISSWIGHLSVFGVMRKGIGFVDPNNADSNQPVNVKIGSLYASRALTIGLSQVTVTVGSRMMHVNRGTADLLRTIVDVDHAEFITHGTLSSDPANCVWTDQDTDVRFGKIDFPLHGAGTLLEAHGRIRAYATADQTTNIGLPTGSTVPLFSITGTTGNTTADGSVFECVVDCGSNHMQQQILLLTSTVNCRVSVKARNYRNKNLVEFAGTNSGLYFFDSEIIGLGGSENGLYFGGTLNDCLFMGTRVSACAVGTKKNGTPTFNNCNGLANRSYSNTTQTDLVNGSVVDRGGSSTFTL